MGEGGDTSTDQLARRVDIGMAPDVDVRTERDLVRVPVRLPRRSAGQVQCPGDPTGIGTDGHLGFNEPPSAADAPTRVIDLAPESIVSNAVYWGDDVPRRAVTAGMDLIMAARQVLVIVAGAHKLEILRRMLEGEPSPDCPASLLRQRAGVIVAADRAALGR